MPLKHLIAVALIVITVGTLDHIHTIFAHELIIYQEQSECVAEYISAGVERNRIITYTYMNKGHCTKL